VEDIVLYFIFFSASLVQVFVVCYYGDEMISSVSFLEKMYICFYIYYS